jgi:hypothetical protein
MQDKPNLLLALKSQTLVSQSMNNIWFLLLLVHMEITSTQLQLKVLLLPRKVTQLQEKMISKLFFSTILSEFNFHQMVN